MKKGSIRKKQDKRNLWVSSRHFCSCRFNILIKRMVLQFFIFPCHFLLVNILQESLNQMCYTDYQKSKGGCSYGTRRKNGTF
jgi:hypothetical protein